MLGKKIFAVTSSLALGMSGLVLAAPQASAANVHMAGVVTCANGNAPEGVYVVNNTSSARSGWANVWGSAGGGAKYYAYDGAYDTDNVRVHVGCGNNWSPTYRSDNVPSTWFGDLYCIKEGLNYHCYLS